MQKLLVMFNATKPHIIVTTDVYYIYYWMTYTFLICIYISWNNISRFQGSVKDVIFTSDDGVLKPQELQESQGIRTSTLHPQHASNGDETADDHCEKDNPCLNGGICISTDAGPICDCRMTDFEGDLCEQSKFLFDIFTEFLHCIKYINYISHMEKMANFLSAHVENLKMIPINIVTC